MRLGAPPPKANPRGRPRAILYGTLVVGTLDALDAIVFFGMRGVSPGRIFQAIASGLLGHSAFEGGAATTGLGVGLHYFIAFGIVGVYSVARDWIPTLHRKPVPCGMLYGILVYGVMNLIVVPLSAVARGPMSAPVVLNGVLIHIVGVGLPSALFARWGRSVGGSEPVGLKRVSHRGDSRRAQRK
jgi:hypothetical protein